MLNRQRQQGFTLIETMVTVFIVAIGLLTAAGLQAVSKKAAFDAMQRTTASVLAQDMLERIRSNSGQVINSLGANVSGGYIGKDVQSLPATVPCGGNSTTSTPCTPGQLVLLDYFQWWEALDGAKETIAAGGSSTGNAGGLRSPVGCVRRVGTTSVIEVIIEWRGMSKIDQTADSNNPDDPVSGSCGFDIADYELDSTTNQSYRRVLRLQSHIQQ